MLEKSIKKRFSRVVINNTPEMVWKLWTMNSNHCHILKGKMNFGEEYFNPAINSEYRMHSWLLEAFFCELLLSSHGKSRTEMRRAIQRKSSDNDQYNRNYKYKEADLDSAYFITDSINKINDIGGLQDKCVIEKSRQDIDWIKRLITQQMEWQTSLKTSNLENFLFWAYIYDFEEIDSAYAAVSGVSFRDMIVSVIGLSALYQKHSTIPFDIQLNDLNLSKDTLGKVLCFLSLDVKNAPKQQRKIVNEYKLRGKVFYKQPIPDHIIYRPSILRKFPLMKCDNGYCAPLPPLLAYRVLNGTYFDLIDNERIKTKISERFEHYVKDFLDLSNSKYDVIGEFSYGPKKHRQASPDIIVNLNNIPSIIVECKASRMDSVVRFSDSPSIIAERGVEELSKGVFQIWRFVADIRNGIAKQYNRVNQDVIGLIVTIDDWVSSYPSLLKEIFSQAEDKVSNHNQKYGNRQVESVDKIGVRFTTIYDLELVNRRIDNDQLISLLQFSITGRYSEYMLYNVLSDFLNINKIKNEKYKEHPMKEFYKDYVDRLGVNR